MTAMPQLVSLFNAVGGGAAALVAIDDYIRVRGSSEDVFSTAIFVVLGAAIGSITFTGSLIASGKLQGLIAGKPIPVPGGRLVTYGIASRQPNPNRAPLQVKTAGDEHQHGHAQHPRSLPAHALPTPHRGTPFPRAYRTRISSN